MGERAKIFLGYFIVKKAEKYSAQIILYISPRGTASHCPGNRTPLSAHDRANSIVAVRSSVTQAGRGGGGGVSRAEGGGQLSSMTRATARMDRAASAHSSDEWDRRSRRSRACSDRTTSSAELARSRANSIRLRPLTASPHTGRAAPGSAVARPERFLGDRGPPIQNQYQWRTPYH